VSERELPANITYDRALQVNAKVSQEITSYRVMAEHFGELWGCELSIGDCEQILYEVKEILEQHSIKRNFWL
jgi:hypothetical protein